MRKTNIFKASLAALALLLAFNAQGQTIRGDFNMDGSVNLTDVTTLINYLINERLPYDEPVKDTITVKGVPFVMVRVDGGTYRRGVYQNGYTMETFWIGQTEVTTLLWETVMGYNPSILRYGDNCPVDHCSYYECEAFIDSLNALTGLTFRMPTEREWEYAALGGNRTLGYKFAGSDNLDEVAWYQANVGDNMFHGYEVATLKPNELGLYDMCGNVAEWCRLDNDDGNGLMARWRGGGKTSSLSDCYPLNYLRWAKDGQEYHVGMRLVM